MTQKHTKAPYLLYCAAIAVALTACGGGGGSSPVATPDPTPPEPTVQRGTSALPGIDRIPLNRITVSNSRMKDMFAIVEIYRDDHMRLVHEVACNSYTIQCDNPASHFGKHRDVNGIVTTFTGTAPFTSITEDDRTDNFSWRTAQVDGMPNLKIASISVGLGNGIIAHKATLPDYLSVQGAGNSSGQPAFTAAHSPTVAERIRRAVAADKLLIVGGWDKDGSGNYIRHRFSSSCKGPGTSEGCVWAQFEHATTLGIRQGTSLSTPQVASALASVLSVFPDTTHQNLARFAKACARKSGNGIEAMLRREGGVGVADFTCMGGVVNALTNLPTNGRTTVTINGEPVSVGGRDVSLSFAPSLAFAGDMEKAGFSFNIVPTGKDTTMLIGTQRMDDLFLSLAFGTEDNFFGLTEGHRGVEATRVTAGHENVFVHLSDMRSNGDDAITSANGRSVGLTVQEKFLLTERSSLTVSLQNERFLGGSAEIGKDGISFGTVNLPKGGWQHRLDVASMVSLDASKTLNLAASVQESQGDEEFVVNTRFLWTF